MKRLVIIFGILFFIFIIVQASTFYSTSKTEEVQYKLIFKDKDFEIRSYPAVIYASYTQKATKYEDMSGNGFRTIASYIFGGNEEKEKIAMTSPVKMEFDQDKSTMSFSMPSAYAMENLPKPSNKNVVLHEEKAKIMATLSFGGYASDEKIKSYAVKLQEQIKKANYKIVGNLNYLGYNPPYQVVGRRNEVSFEVEKITE